MKNLLNKFSLSMTLAIAGLIGYTNFAKAAADTDFATATAMIKTGIDDNKGQALIYAAGVAVVALLMALAFKLFGWGKGQILGSFGRRGGRRR